MYAIVETGGKQYKVAENYLINVEKLEANVGDKVNLNVLMVVDGEKVKAGNDVKDAKVVAEVMNTVKIKRLLFSNIILKRNIVKHKVIDNLILN